MGDHPAGPRTGRGSIAKGGSRSPMSDRADVFEVPIQGEVDYEAAEAAPLAGFQLGGRRPPLIVF